MSKRRISKQQSSRIARKQRGYLSETEHNSSQLSEGLVITRFRHRAEVEDSQGARFQCSIRTNIDSLVAGDRVVWQAENEEQGVILSRYPRQTVLSRTMARGHDKAIAANITQLVVVIAPKPEISWPLLDSYLIMAKTLQFHALIILNKIDLPCEAMKQRLYADYQQLEYKILQMTENSKEGYSALHQALEQHVSVFVGQSGVGKSSLIANLLPQENDIAIQAISEQSEFGRHTTSYSRYYSMPEGGAIIDSPGIRSFKLSQMEPAAILQGYPEFIPFLAQCKFRNCTHIESNHCGIIEAVNEGKISVGRYDNFVKLCQQV